MTRFEFSEGSSNKFWEAETKGKELRIRFGKIGSAGQLKLKVLGSPAAAEAEMAKVIAEKVKKGYAPAGGETPVAVAKASKIKPTQLKITNVSSSKVHRIVLFDDEVGHVALGTGGNCFASRRWQEVPAPAEHARHVVWLVRVRRHRVLDGRPVRGFERCRRDLA